MKNASALTGAGLPLELIIPMQIEWLFKPAQKLKNAIYAYYNISDKLKIKVLGGFPGSKIDLQKFFHSVIATFYVLLSGKKYDIVYTRNQLSAIICLVFGKKFFFETYRRLGHESPRAMGFFAKRAKSKAFMGMVLHSQVAKDSMLSVGFPDEKLLVLHNGYDDADMQPKLSKAEARKQLGLEVSETYVVYTGNMQKNKCIESLVDIAALLPQVQFLLVGGTPEDLERLNAYAAEKGAKNVLLPGRQPISDVSKYLYASDFLIIPPVSAPLEKFGRTVLPFKIFPYLAAGRVIIAADQADMRELLKHQQNALLVEGDNPDQNAQAIAELLNNKDLCDELAQNAAELSKNLTWEKRAERFVTWLRGVY